MGHRILAAGLVWATLQGFASAQAGGEEWPQWGRTPARNMASPARGLPDDFAVGEFIGSSNEIDPKTSRNVRWIARLGSQSYGNPTVAHGRVLVGTNNDVPRDPRLLGDRSTLYCFSEKNGAFLWQLAAPKLGTGQVSDWEHVGICSSAAIDGDRVYLVTNRCEVICLDLDGMADGNDGPFTAEGSYLAGPGEEPLEVTARDADIIWVLDMMARCGVRPHNITASSVLVVGDRLWVTTSNGVDVDHRAIPAPEAPCLILLDKKTGELLGQEASGLSRRMFHCNWTSPAYLRGGGRELAIFGGPDGYCYAFEPEPVDDGAGRKVLREAWRCDCNKLSCRTRKGEKIPYGTRRGPSEVIATPAVYDGRIYALVGQDPDNGEGVGNLVCIDPRGRGDITKSGVLWSYGKINRSMSMIAIAGDLLFAADLSGFVYCLDARSGAEHWVHDTMAHIWGAPLVADGKVYIGNEDGILYVIPASAELDPDEVREIEIGAPIFSTPIAAGGTLYIATQTHLFAIGEERGG